MAEVLNPVSNREDWVITSEVRDQDNVLVDLSSAEIRFAVRARHSGIAMLTAGTGSSTPATIDSVGVFTIHFTPDQMSGFDCSRVYEVGCTIKINGVTFQYLRGTVSILDGVVE